MPSKPHGGKLINRVLTGKRREYTIREAGELESIDIDEQEYRDLENIAYGIYSPLTGFMNREDFENVISNMRLVSDIPWTIPITLDIDVNTLAIREGDDLALKYKGKIVAILHVEEIYKYDKKKYAKNVFKTDDLNHPGVKKLYNYHNYLVGGDIELVNRVIDEYDKYFLTPKETRILFIEKGWKTIVGFQTRNAPHLGHEYVQKTALTFVDGLFINPVIGRKKKGDFRDEVILAAYNTLIKNYYPRNSVVLSIVRYEMRYAGPREAIHHAIMRKNFGCTHFIIGRDHAGVGNYYGPYEAQEIFFEFPDLGITPLFFREFFYCRKCGGVSNDKICPHEKSERVYISGTKIRESIKKGLKPPIEMMRPEVADTILSFEKPFIE